MKQRVTLQAWPFLLRLGDKSMLGRWRVWLGFFGLCLLSGSKWLLDTVWTNPLSPGTQVAFGYGLLALPLRIVLARRARKPLAWRQIARLAGWSAVLFALPTSVGAAARGHVESFTTILLFTLVPAVVVFVAAQQTVSFGSSDGPFGRLLPALAGTGGAALMLPWITPSDAAGWFWLALLVLTMLLAGVAAIELHAALQQFEVLEGLAWIAGAASLADLIGCVLVWTPPTAALTRADAGLELASVVVFTLPTLVLAVWLLRVMEPVAFSSRYLLVPLLTIAEGYVVLRPEVTWTTPAGLALMALGVVSLLRTHAAKEF